MIVANLTKRPVAALAIVHAVIDRLQDLTLENQGRIGEVDAVLGQILAPLALTPLELVGHRAM